MEWILEGMNRHFCCTLNYVISKPSLMRFIERDLLLTHHLGSPVSKRSDASYELQR